MQKNRRYWGITSRDTGDQRILQYDSTKAFWPIIREPEYGVHIEKQKEVKPLIEGYFRLKAIVKFYENPSKTQSCLPILG